MNQFIIAAGLSAIKMQPETFASAGRGILMRGIAVQKYELTGCDLTGIILCAQGETAVEDIHEQEAVKGIAVQFITWLIQEIASADGIEEGVLRCQAGSVLKIF